MPKALNIRDVPDEITDWIATERNHAKMTQQEFVVSVLRRAYQDRETPTLFDEMNPPPPPPRPQSLPFRFIDLFAGIGGLRIGLEKVGGKCVFSCEINKYAQKTYAAWFGDTPEADIRELKAAEIPEHHVLAAGFPCQPFSIAGVSKKKSLGMEHGFKDVTQGTMFFHLATIIEVRRPPVLILENVKNLRSHDKGKTWQVIKGALEELDYHIFDGVVDAAGWVPQHRERVFIIGFHKSVFPTRPTFAFPSPPEGRKPQLKDILDPNPPEKYTLTDHLWTYLQEYAARHRAKGNGFGFGLANPDGITRTLSARYYKDGSEILIPQTDGKNPRRLTPDEAKRLMGFPDRLKVVVSDTQAYKQFGNAVVPLVAEAVGREVVKTMAWNLAEGTGCLLNRVRPRKNGRTKVTSGA